MIKVETESEASDWGEDKRAGLLLSGSKFSIQIKLNIAFTLDGPSVHHPSILDRFSAGQQPNPDLPLPSITQILRRDPEVLPGQPGDIVSPACQRKRT